MSKIMSSKEHRLVADSGIEEARALRLGAVRELREGNCSRAVVWTANALARAESAIAHAGSVADQLLVRKAHREWMLVDTLLRKAVARRCDGAGSGGGQR